MANLKDIKTRIQSVQNTRKITRAMKMVAAAKVKKAESTVKSARPFATELSTIFKRMLSAVNGEYSVENLKCCPQPCFLLRPCCQPPCN